MKVFRDFKILAIDDDSTLLRSLQRILSAEPYKVITTTDPAQGLLIMEEEQIDLVLLDLQMPRRNGLSVLEDMVNLYPDVTVIILTGHGGVQEAVKALKLGAADFLEKPCPPPVLCKILATYHSIFLQRRSLEKNRNQPFEYPGFIGESSVMQRLKALITRIAVSEAPVLILGESGTGKELVARAVHHHSTRNEGPFCAIDCAAINESVLESELFGYERGAFTGADRPTQGLIRSADKGTLFLDEIGEIPLKMQAKLLRTLQEHEVRPVGSTTSKPVDIRIIAATNRDLEHETTQGLFRSDLYFRISAIPLLLPPLRERLSDIPLLAHHILKSLTKETTKGISSEALRLLQAYAWPGNVRELENVLRRALALSEQNAILPADLPATIVVENKVGHEISPANDSLMAYEQSAVENALRKTTNNKRKAAALLGISEATLYRKLKQFGLSN
ncbi:MAG: sigma-54-dependent Fis family transcriptional regulator [Desulfobulbaceae bacterium]|nr:sigma-54-dependent Fis family transcriptional regulator [Desulfobulbaceae bacterium]